MEVPHVLTNRMLPFVVDCSSCHSQQPWFLLSQSNQAQLLSQLNQARAKLQGAIDESHPAPPASYLRESAAACLLYGLQSVPSGFHMTAVPCTQVAGHVQARCPDKPDVMQRLQNSKYFVVIGRPGIPDHFLLDLHAIIMPHQLPQVTDILASIKSNQVSKVCPDQPEPTRLTMSSQVRQCAACLKTSHVWSDLQAIFMVAGCRSCKGLTANRRFQEPWFPHSHMVEGNFCCMHRHGFASISLRITNEACHLPAVSYSHARPVARA